MTSGSDECLCHKVRQPGRVFHPFSVEVDETRLALTNGFDRRVKAQDIHILSACGEMTITLQDVVVLLDFRIDDPEVTGSDDRDWAGECERLLSVAPSFDAL